MVSIPRLVIAAPRSGSGKTTVASGLMAAFTARGVRVSPHKVGPDFIDPTYHAVASGRPGRNLDPWLVGEERIAPLFAAGSRGADIAIVEGVMGLFDGVAGRGDEGSTAQVAKLLGAPVVLVVDATGTARSIAALVHGFTSFDPTLRLAGVILTKVGSARHELILREALQPLRIPVLGAIRRDESLAVPSRHLGLVPVAERPREVAGWLDRITQLTSQQVDLEAVMAIAKTAGPLHTQPWTPPVSAPEGPPITVAIATGAAFTFGYAETTEALTAAGATIAPFDPLSDEALPSGTDALVVGGGFPEIYATALAANERLRTEVRAHAEAGRPIIAECGGLLWLAAELDGARQCGVIDATARMTPKLVLGYREAVTVRDSPLAAAGTTVRAHEFHRTETLPGAGADAAWRFEDGRLEGWSGDTLHASYLHVHWAGLPDAAPRLVRAASRRGVPA